MPSSSKSSVAPQNVEEQGDKSMLKKRHSFSCLSIFVAALIVAALVTGVTLIVYFTTRPSEEAAAAPPVQPDWTANLEYRLPGELIATHYTIFILPNFTHGIPKEFAYHGRSEIHLHVKKATNRVVLHAVKDLINVVTDTVKLYTREQWNSLNKNTDCMWTVNNQEPGLTPKDLRYVPEFEYVAFLFDKQLLPGEEYVLRLAWDGPITSALQGFYWSSYKDSKGVEQYLTATHFSSIHARRAFPCLDELDIKATFDMRMLTYADHNLGTLSNTPLERRVQCVAHNGRECWSNVYGRTVNMSTYLVAYAFSTHKSVEMIDDDNRVHRLWSQPDMVNRLEYAKTVSAPILYFFERIFGIKYDYMKLDHISLPDFSAGAMENWGLITYREERLFYLDNVDSVNQKQRVAMIVAHEVAHQWFGNLVTIGWFSDLWITEGFARYLQYVSMNEITRDWNLFIRFHNDVQMAVLRTDSLSASRPLSYPVGNNIEVRDMFDTITYDKGAAIIHMMRYWIGDGTFWKALKLYLKRHSYSNSYPEYLAQALEEQAFVEGHNFKVTEVLPTWVYQNGYPVVKMTLTRRDNKVYVRMEQRKFLLNGKIQGDVIWKVPATIQFHNSATVQPYLLEQKSQEFEVTPGTDDVFLGNPDMTGFYRVNYETNHWLQLARLLKEPGFSNIKEVDRGALIDNAFALARTGDANYTVTLDLASYLCQDIAFMPWTAAISNLEYLELMAWNNQVEYTALVTHWRLVIQPVYNKLIQLASASGEELAPITLARTNVITKACNIDLESCIQTANTNFAAWMADKTIMLDPDTRQNTLCTAIRNGGDTEWQQLYDHLTVTLVSSERTIFINALGCSKNSAKLYKWLNDTYAAINAVPTPEFENIYSAISRNLYAKDISRQFFFENWEPLCTKPASTSVQRSIITSMFNTANTQAELTQVQQFFNTNEAKLSYAEAPLRQVLENIEINIIFEREYADDIIRWLQSPGAIVNCPEL